MCHGQNSLTHEENNNLNFQPTCDQAINLETAANLCASHSHANNFFQVLFYFGLGGITKHLMPASMGNSEFYLFLTLSVDGPGEAKLTCFPWSQSSFFKSRKACETSDIVLLVRYVAMSCLFRHASISSFSLQISSRNTVTLLVSQYIWMAHALTPFRCL